MLAIYYAIFYLKYSFACRKKNHLFCSYSQVLGTPTEKDWEGVTRLRGYRQNVEKIGLHRGMKLGYEFPRLYDIAEGEALASAFLQVSILRCKKLRKMLNILAVFLNIVHIFTTLFPFLWQCRWVFFFSHTGTHDCCFSPCRKKFSYVLYGCLFSLN